MALTVHDRAVVKLTVEVVTVMASHGLFEERRVELLDGVLTEKPMQEPPHTFPIRLLQRWLSPLVLAGAHDVDVQMPLVGPDRYSLPEPDIAVVPRVPPGVHPSAAFLIVEVAHTSLRPDTTRKVELYALAKVPDYWVIDVVGRMLQIRRDPVGGAYRSLERFGPADAVAPLALDLRRSSSESCCGRSGRPAA